MGNRNLKNCIYIFFTLICVYSAYAEIQETADIITNTLESAKLKEEINLTGVTLEEMIGDAPRLKELKEISLKTYRLEKPLTEEESTAISDAYKNSLLPQDWQAILIHKDDDNRMVMIYGKEKDGIREKLLTVILIAEELSEMVLTGEVELSALEELRRVVLESIPRFNEAQPLANFFRSGEKREAPPQPDYMNHPAYQSLLVARDLFKEGKYQEALSKYLDIIGSKYVPEEANEWWQIETYMSAAKISKIMGDTEKEKEYYKILLMRFGHINSPELTEAQKNLLILERGRPLPFLGLGFRHSGSVEGAYIVTVFKNGPCANAGIQKSDLLVAIDNEPTPNPRSVINIIGRKNVGDTINLTIKRGEEIIKTSVMLIETPSTLER